MSLFTKLFGGKVKDGETDEQATARLEQLAAVFPDQEFVKAEFAAGHNAAEAVLALREIHTTAMETKTAEITALNVENTKLTAKSVDHGKEVATLKAAIADQANRPPVNVKGDAGTAPDAAAAFKADPKLQAEFGNIEAFKAYTAAVASGRVRMRGVSAV